MQPYSLKLKGILITMNLISREFSHLFVLRRILINLPRKENSRLLYILLAFPFRRTLLYGESFKSRFTQRKKNALWKTFRFIKEYPKARSLAKTRSKNLWKKIYILQTLVRNNKFHAPNWNSITAISTLLIIQGEVPIFLGTGQKGCRFTVSNSSNHKT